MKFTATSKILVFKYLRFVGDIFMFVRHYAEVIEMLMEIKLETKKVQKNNQALESKSNTSNKGCVQQNPTYFYT